MRIVQQIPGRVAAAPLRVHQLQVAEQAVEHEGQGEYQLVGAVESDGLGVYRVQGVTDRGAGNAHHDQAIEERLAVAFQSGALSGGAVRIAVAVERDELRAPLSEPQEESEHESAQQQ